MNVFSGQMKDLYIQSQDLVNEHFGWSLDDSNMGEMKIVPYENDSEKIMTRVKVVTPLGHYHCWVVFNKSENGWLAERTFCKDL